MKTVKDTITFTVVLNDNSSKVKSRIQPIGRMIEFEEGKKTFVSSQITGSENLRKGETVFLMGELLFIDEGDYTMSGTLKRTEKNVWYFVPDNVKMFFKIFKKDFNIVL